MLIAGYLEPAFNPAYMTKAGEFFARMVREIDFDTVVVTGASGLLVGPGLARTHGKQLLVARKPGDGSHSSCILPGYHGRRLVLVDDLVASGDTVRRVARMVREYHRGTVAPTWAGLFLWGDTRSYASDWISELGRCPMYACNGCVWPDGRVTNWFEKVTTSL